MFLARKLTRLALLTALVNLQITPVMATDIMGGGSTGGSINNLGGANLNKNETNYAQIGITGNGNIIKWDYFNIGAGKHLDFNFIKDGQVALNKILGGGMSTVAGQLSTSGANGQLIISNPSGMLFTGGAIVNANSLILTTKDVNWDGKLNGKIELKDNQGTQGITINSAQFNIAQDLNIIAPQIDIKGKIDNNANLMAGTNVRLITSDGVTFWKDSVSDLKNASQTDNGNINIDNANLSAIKDNKNGNVYIASRGDIKISNSVVKGDLTADAQYRTVEKTAAGTLEKGRGDVAITNTSVDGNAKLAGTNFTIKGFAADDLTAQTSYKSSQIDSKETFSRGSLYAEGLNLTGNAILQGNGVTLTNSNIKGNIDMFSNSYANISNLNKNIANYGDLKVNYAQGISLTDANSANMDLTSSEDIILSSIKTNNLAANTGHSFDIKDFTAGDITVKMDSLQIPVKSANITNGTANNVTIAPKVAGRSFTSTISGLKATGKLDVTANSIDIKNSTADKLALTSTRADIELTNVNTTGTERSSVNSAADVIYTNTNVKNTDLTANKNFSLKTSDSRYNYGISNSKISAVNAISANNSTGIVDSELTAKQINASKATINHSILNSTGVANQGTPVNIYASGSTITNSTLTAKNDIQIGSSKVTGSTLTANNDLKFGGATLNKTTASGRYAFLNNAKLENKTEVTAKIATGDTYSNGVVENLTMSDSKLTATTKDINLSNSNVGNKSTVNAANGNINISGSGMYVWGSNLVAKTVSADKGAIIKGGSSINAQTFTSRGNAYIKQGSKINAQTIDVQNSHIEDSSILNASGDLTVKNSSIKNGTIEMYGNTINIDNLDEWASSTTNLIAKSTYGTTLNNVEANDLTAYARWGKTSVTDARATGNVEIYGPVAVTVNKITGNDLKITSTNDYNSSIRLENAQMQGNITLDSYDTQANNLSGKNISFLNAKHDAVLTNATMSGDINVSGMSNVNVQNVSGKDLTATSQWGTTTVSNAKMTGDVITSGAYGSKLTNVSSDNLNASGRWGATTLIDTIAKNTMTVDGVNVALVNSSSKNLTATAHHGSDLTLNNFKTGTTELTADNNVNIIGGSALGSTTISTQNLTINEGSSLSKIINSNVSRNTEIDTNSKINIASSALGDARIKTTKDVNINSSTKANSLDITSDGNVTLSTIEKIAGLLKINGKKVTVNGTTDSIGSMDLNSSGDLIVNSTKVQGITNLNSGKNIIIKNKSNLLGNVTANANDNVTVEGSNFGGNVNITKAKDVVISNNNAQGNQSIVDEATGTPVTDYDRTQFTTADFEKIAEKYGNNFGLGNILTNIKGNLDIKNVDSVLVINSVVEGNLTQSNIAGNSNLITSLVKGNFVPDRLQEGKISVYSSYINGNYEHGYDYQLANNDIDNVAINEINRNKYGETIDTNFRRQFSPRGFAADDDEIKARINAVVNSSRAGANNSIILSERFIAE